MNASLDFHLQDDNNERVIFTNLLAKTKRDKEKKHRILARDLTSSKFLNGKKKKTENARLFKRWKEWLFFIFM